jgi:hypothetical protein
MFVPQSSGLSLPAKMSMPNLAWLVMCVLVLAFLWLHRVFFGWRQVTSEVHSCSVRTYNNGPLSSVVAHIAP